MAIGNRILDECQSGRILPGLVDTAATLELGNLSCLDCVECAISREEMVNHLPPLYKLEQLVKDELTENEEAIRIAEQQANEQRIRDEEAKVAEEEEAEGRAPSKQVAVAEGTADSTEHRPPSPGVPQDGHGDAERTELANTISENRHAMAAASALSSIAGMHSLGGELGPGLSLLGGKWGNGDDVFAATARCASGSPSQ